MSAEPASTIGAGIEDAGTPAAPLASTLCGAFQRTAGERAGKVALRTLGGGVSIAWAQYAQRVQSIAEGLAALGVDRGETVGIMLVNRPEFNLLDTAALHLGATPFSIYNTSSAEQIAYIFANAGNRVLVSERQFLPAIAAAGVDAIEHVVCVDAPSGGVELSEDGFHGLSGRVLTLAELESLQAPGGFDFETSWRSVRGDELATLCYTSGTTGPPKGVELTHANVLAMSRAAEAVVAPDPDGRIISYLPHAHMADRGTTHYVSIIHGTELTALADVRQIAAALLEVRPTRFLSVPRVWEKMKASLEAAIAAEPDLERRQAVQWAIDMGLARVRAEQAGEPLSAELLADCERADELVLSKLRERLGLDQASSLGVGAAPTPLDVLEFFHAVGLPLCEGWGMSELTCVGTGNRPDAVKLGTVGPPVPGVEVLIAEDGELLCRGELVMRGYRSDPERTAEAIDSDGWLHTGDIATIDSDGYVKIIDRKKELIINAAGKNMSPANIESHIKSASPLIGQAIAIGDRRPYNVALLVLDPDGAGVWAAEHGLADATPATLAEDPGVGAEIARAVEQANTHLSRVEQIKRFAVLPCDWLPGGDELTPTMKLKRKPIAQKYATEIETLYADG
ncbi:MAG: AMP-dependent synthetase/ligase [Solirubrobacteraceae bacterium]